MRNKEHVDDKTERQREFICAPAPEAIKGRVPDEVTGATLASR